MASIHHAPVFERSRYAHQIDCVVEAERKGLMLPVARRSGLGQELYSARWYFSQNSPPRGNFPDYSNIQYCL